MVGQEFFGSPSSGLLQDSLVTQGTAYFAVYHTSRLETKSWTVYPVKTDFNFRLLTEFSHLATLNPRLAATPFLLQIGLQERIVAVESRVFLASQPSSLLPYLSRPGHCRGNLLLCHCGRGTGLTGARLPGHSGRQPGHLHHRGKDGEGSLGSAGGLHPELALRQPLAPAALGA